jgi:hypothetical protein
MKQFTLKEGWQLAILRTGVAITIITKVFVEFDQLELMFSKNGIIQDMISRPLEVSYVLSLHDMIDFFHIQDQHLFLVNLYSCFAVSGFLLLIGFQTKLNALICLFIHMSFFNSYNLIAFGFDGFLFSLLFYCLIFPVQKIHSVDALLNKKAGSPDREQLKLCLLLIRLHLCIVYFTAGFAKLGGQEWMNGTAIWKAINQPQFYTALTPFMKSLASHPLISYVLSWGTLALETSFPFLIWIRWGKLRLILVGSVILMHVFIGAAMGLQLFAWIMIVFDLSAFANVFLLPPARTHTVIADSPAVLLDVAV